MDPDIPPVFFPDNFFLRPIQNNDEELPFEEPRNYNLRPEQQEIYNHVFNNPNNIVVIDGYPGWGKTFTLRAIAHNWERPANVIIYRDDLLGDFENIGRCQNIDIFFKGIFDLFNDTYPIFEKELTGSLNNAEFILTIVNLMAKADLRQLHGSLVIFDEYTVIPKPLLLVTLMLLKHYKIGAILCGDKCQILNDKSVIMGNCTSYDMANFFADRTFQLEIEETDSRKKIVKYMRELASDDWIDDFGRSLIAALFHKRLISPAGNAVINLAGSRELEGLENFNPGTTNIMTARDIQGLRITDNVAISFKLMTYREMYIAVSRMEEISQIVTVSMDDYINPLVSCVINFSELVDPNIDMAGIVKDRMSDYRYYNISIYKPAHQTTIKILLRNFFRARCMQHRHDIRELLVRFVSGFIELNPIVRGDWTSSPIHEILKYTDYWLGLACMEEGDRGIWLTEFLARTPALRSLTGPGIEHKNIDINHVLYTFAGLYTLPQWNDIRGFIEGQEMTPFMREIYIKYIDGHEITTEWLVGILNGTIREHMEMQMAVEVPDLPV